MTETFHPRWGGVPANLNCKGWQRSDRELPGWPCKEPGTPIVKSTNKHRLSQGTQADVPPRGGPLQDTAAGDLRFCFLEGCLKWGGSLTRVQSSDTRQLHSAAAIKAEKCGPTRGSSVFWCLTLVFFFLQRFCSHGPPSREEPLPLSAGAWFSLSQTFLGISYVLCSALCSVL